MSIYNDIAICSRSKDTCLDFNDGTTLKEYVLEENE